MGPTAPRSARIDALRSRRFDVLVIGGGITGCGIARAATRRGLSVALVEKDDFASGTSSRSSRLVHGGVRYLEHGHLRLVFESSAERRRLLRLAPHLVRPLAFTWPVYRGARIPRWKLAAGLALYDALALFRNVGRHSRLSRAGVLAREPELRREDLRGGAGYFDASTDDARLTLANALDAAASGGCIVNHAAVQGLMMTSGRVGGARVVDALTGESLDVHANVVVNATGPWSDDVRRLGGETGSDTRGSKGVHVAVPRDRIGNHGALTLLSPTDGRVLFILPSGAQATVGTTDTYTTSSPDEVRATEGDVRYLLATANFFFPNARLTREDVIGAWAGIRPLVASSAAAPGAVSREHAVSVSERGLVSITGGKLTTYRVMADDVLDVVTRELGTTPGHGTNDRPLCGGDVSLDAAVAAATAAIGDPAFARRLVERFGSRWSEVWSIVNATPEGRTAIDAAAPYTLGELFYSVRHEMACTLGDLLIRRTHLAFETRDHGRAAAERIAPVLAARLGWDTKQVAREVGRYSLEIERIFTVDPGE
ncbi:MAG TPA: glycerol-3-phosphate dehydrogenase/oxidase [Gemmatimonadaceae bacterium]